LIQALLQGGAEQEKLVLHAEQKGGKVTRPAMVSARERALALSYAPEPRGVPAVTSLSRRWVTSRAEATPEPLAAYRASAAHLER
jgi:hypothetical protein